MHKTKLLMFAGAGSVGKTEALKAVVALAERRVLKVMQHTSTTRQTYAAAGYTRESEALRDPVVNREFQRRVMADNAQELTSKLAVAQAECYDLLVCDRSPHDYASYQTTVFGDTLTIRDLALSQLAADQVIADLTRFDNPVHVFFLDYPAYWSQDTESSDGWRSDSTGKNWAWSCQCKAMLQQLADRCGPDDNFYLERPLSTFMMNDVAETRAIGFLDRLFPSWV